MVISDPPRAYWAVVVGNGGLAQAIVRKLLKLNFRIVICGRRCVRTHTNTSIGRRCVRTHTNNSIVVAGADAYK
jgi:shikimate 5-dehydrogenase